MARRAVFLDRDGVLIRDVDLLSHAQEVELLPDAPDAMVLLKDHGFMLLVVTNQTVVARGLCTLDDVERAHAELDRRLRAAAAPAPDAYYVCPHHPNADDPAYRVECDCRKPRAGLLRRAAAEHDLDLPRSFMVGDRLSDIAAGVVAGCTTVLVETGSHVEPPIVSPEPIPKDLAADHVTTGLRQAAEWIIGA